MKQRMCVVTVSLLLLALGVEAGHAQVRQISGRITNVQTDQPVAEATVAVLGTQIVAQASSDGRFILNAPDGAANLVVRGIGFKRQQIVVPAGQETVDVKLEPDVFKLEEIVITGQATGVENRNLANAVSTVSAAELTRAPTPTIESALQGKIPGATISSNSGAPGGGLQVNLRGVSTIIGDLEPLYVVDGIVVSDVAIPNGANAVTQAQAGGNPRNQDNPVNRIADINPEDIERIEVLKGGSAAAIYGSKATNGVIFITTKRGQVGKPQFNFTQRLGFAERSNELGARTFTLDEANARFDPALVAQYFQPGKVFDAEKELFGHKPLSYETDASVSGGTENTRYYVSALVKDDGGIATNTGYKKQAVRSNLDQELGGGFQLSVNMSGTHSISRRGLSNNDNSGTSPFLVLPFTPTFVDLQPTVTATGDSLVATDFPRNPFSTSNPLQTFQFLKNDEDVWRIIGTSSLRWAPIKSAKSSLQFIGTGGVDYFQQDNNFVSPPELQFEPNDGQPGTVVLSKSSNRNLNLGLNATHTYLPGDPEHGTQWTTSAGLQFEERRLFATQILGRVLLPGQTSPQQAANQTVLSRLEPVRDLGIFGQEEVLLANRRLLLTAGGRADRSSANGSPYKFFFYPKFAASYVFQHPFGGLDEFKVRAAYGQTGNRAAFGALFSPDTSGTIGGNTAIYIGTRAGDPNLKPERQKEIETGFDATLANGRAQVSLTLYQKNISDLLLERTLAPSFGQENQIFSSPSTLRNQGIEAALTVQAVQSKDINWVLRTTFYANRAKITQLAVPTFQTGGFALSLGTFQIEQDSSPTQIFGLVGTDAAGNPLAGKVGDANPDFQMSFSSDVDFHRLTLGMLWDYKQGGDIINLTEYLYDAGQTSADYLEPGGGKDRQDRINAGFTDAYVQSGTYLKLREVNLSYNLPDGITSALFGRRIRTARLSLTGRNLLRFTPYRGLDPEVSNFGRQAIVRNIDVAPFPPSRSFFFSIDVGF
jgi:TonB-linked SusC/RagA family outer membrane protein